jgi:hypothetical protein
MPEERSDQYIVGRLIERTKLLIALSDEIPIETKLQAQGILKMFEAEMRHPEEEQNQPQVRSYYSVLCRDLSEYADLDALLGAMKNFISYL